MSLKVLVLECMSQKTHGRDNKKFIRELKKHRNKSHGWFKNTHKRSLSQE
jgi:uncharacterized C2H2 Zn-finger protein